MLRGTPSQTRLQWLQAMWTTVTLSTVMWCSLQLHRQLLLRPQSHVPTQQIART